MTPWALSSRRKGLRHTSRPLSCSTNLSMEGSVGAAWSLKPKLSLCTFQHGT